LYPFKPVSCNPVVNVSQGWASAQGDSCSLTVETLPSGWEAGDKEEGTVLTLSQRLRADKDNKNNIGVSMQVGEISTLVQQSPYVLYRVCVMNVGGCCVHAARLRAGRRCSGNGERRQAAGSSRHDRGRAQKDGSQTAAGKPWILTFVRTLSYKIYWRIRY
jgi:hypothetical protein